MEHTYSYNQKKCATCEYWGGSGRLTEPAAQSLMTRMICAARAMATAAAQAAITSGRMLIADIL